jgi:hypothetical protein
MTGPCARRQEHHSQTVVNRQIKPVIKGFMKNTIFTGLLLLLLVVSITGLSQNAKQAGNLPYAKLPDVMPGTRPLAAESDRSIRILDNAHLFIEKKIREAAEGRARFWQRDLTSREAYERSVQPNRQRLMEALGVEDTGKPLSGFKLELKDQHPPLAMEKYSVDNDPIIVAETPQYRVYQVRWPVLNRMNGEGLLLEPKSTPLANVVAIPDADQTPEQLAGLAEGIHPASQFARRLAENGYQVLIPVLASRKYLFPGTTQQQTHREWIYRQAFHMGRHIIGFEVQKVLRGIDWFRKTLPEVKTAVAGYHEGGLIALYAAAVDTRIDAALVSGYFNSREKVYDEPLYRNVHALLNEFGDAEIASLIAPRALVVEHSAVPELVERSVKAGDPEEKIGQWPFTGYKGTLTTPTWESVRAEYARIAKLTRPGFLQGTLVSAGNNQPAAFGSAQALESFTSLLGGRKKLTASGEAPREGRQSFNPEERQLRQVKESSASVLRRQGRRTTTSPQPG